MHQVDQMTNIRPKTMSDGSRPTSRWSSSRLTTTTTTQSNTRTNQLTPLIVSRKKLLRQARNNPQTFAHMTKAKHDMEEIFKLYYSNNTKLETFKQTVTGTHISSPPAPIPVPSYFTDNSSDVFRVRHCVSREDMSPLDMHYNEYQIAIHELNQLPNKPPSQLRTDHNPMIIQSVKLLPSPVEESMPSHSNLITPKNILLTREDPLSLAKPTTYSRDISSNSLEQRNVKRSKSAYGQRPISSTTSSSIPIAAYSFANNRKDAINLSHSSLSTSNSSQEQNQPHILTGTAMTTHQRLSARSARSNQRPKSTMTVPATPSSQQSNLKTSPLSFDSEMSDFPVHFVTQSVASIPSKCSRYVLITIPQAPTRYTIPTSVERLLLPERFPVLFQNILHSSGHHK